MFANEFRMIDWDGIDGKGEELTAEEKYRRIVEWARQARGTNPTVFDSLVDWMLDDSQWTDDKLADNERILTQGVFARFKEQNAWLRTRLKELEPAGVVNGEVFKALDRFDDELSGLTHHEGLRETVAKMFADFTTMRDRAMREKIAGNKTGPAGTDNQESVGYVNFLNGCDAQVQWCLFMPDFVKRQQNGFQVERFEYRKIQAMRFVGKERGRNDSPETRREIFRTLDAMTEYKSGFYHDLLLSHHYGKGVDAEPRHDFFGRFMKADAPVPQGFAHWDFLPDDAGAPYLTFRSEFAYAAFSGDADAMRKTEGYDVSAMYDVTRNIILGQGVHIPYPEIYWTAEVFTEGHDKPSAAFLFSVILD
ncbi:MAG: hypothetical protein FWE09_01765 [Treponema sp.]|nr:hypothetical protein [Treponema sp.]